MDKLISCSQSVSQRRVREISSLLGLGAAHRCGRTKWSLKCNLQVSYESMQMASPVQWLIHCLLVVGDNVDLQRMGVVAYQAPGSVTFGPLDLPPQQPAIWAASLTSSR